jgi:tRNA-splicing ligase RtcB
VIPTKGAIVPAAVGVDIGCGMAALRTSIRAADLPDGLAPLRSAIEAAVPHGGPGAKGSWQQRGYRRPGAVATTFSNRYPSGHSLAERLDLIVEKHAGVAKAATMVRDQLGTLGGGNHFIEICLDDSDRVWVMLHSGSRGVGNKIGAVFIERAKEHLAAIDAKLADRNLAWLEEGTAAFDDYVTAVGWAQDYARANRALMMESVLTVLRTMFPALEADALAVNCHHNYVARETHFGEQVWVTRKGAVRAGAGELGIIPGSMGARSFIVRGKGNAESFETCSHGAGRVMSRSAAKQRFTLEDHARATAHVECRKDAGVIDETPAAYKDIDAVMAAQADLVEIVHTLRQVVCVKG